MRITLMLCLPRDSATLPVVRHIAGCSLRELGVETEAIDDVELAITEALANVIKHAGSGDLYEVHLMFEDSTCEIRIVDAGRGFDSSAHAVTMSEPAEEQGRGMAMITSLMDSVRFESRPEAGTVVHLVKELSMRPDGPLENRPVEH